MCEKCLNTELVLVRTFLYSDCINRILYISVFSANTGKYGPEKTPYLGTFHAVYFEISLVLPLRCKVINAKNFLSKNLKRKFKYCNVNIFNSSTSVIAEFPTSNFIFVISLQKKIEPHVFVLSILQFIWQDLAIVCKSFNMRKKYVLIIGI